MTIKPKRSKKSKKPAEKKKDKTVQLLSQLVREDLAAAERAIKVALENKLESIMSFQTTVRAKRELEGAISRAKKELEDLKAKLREEEGKMSSSNEAVFEKWLNQAIHSVQSQMDCIEDLEELLERAVERHDEARDRMGVADQAVKDAQQTLNRLRDQHRSLTSHLSH